MNRNTVVRALLGCSAIMWANAAQAQDTQAEPDASDSTANAAIAEAQPVSEAEAKMQLLEAQVEALQEQIEGLKGALTKSTPSWKGAPQVEDKEAGWSFKPRGRLMYDAATVSKPDGLVLGGNDAGGLGFSNEVRRARLGVEGGMPGGFGYKFEVDVANGDVEFADAFLSYKNGGLEIDVGQHNNFQSLEELTSSLHTSFIERAAFTDAFGFERRVGVSAQYTTGDLLLQAGVFTDDIAGLNGGSNANNGDRNNSYGYDGRLVFAPKLGEHQLHFGASAHFRDLNSAATSVTYRQRPAVHTTDVRFINTGAISGARTETGLGLEAAGIFGSFHVASEAYWQKVGRADLADPRFFGGYVEAGYFLTGETRGYKGGKFDRVKVLKPVGKGGMGALSLNARFDYLDLVDAGIVGGTQNALQASLNWKPIDFVMFGLNYARMKYDDAAIAVQGDRDYSVDMIGLRSQIDF